MKYKTSSTSHIGLNQLKRVDHFQLKRTEIIASDTIKDLDNKIKGYFDYLSFKP